MPRGEDEKKKKVACGAKGGENCEKKDQQADAIRRGAWYHGYKQSKQRSVKELGKKKSLLGGGLAFSSS